MDASTGKQRWFAAVNLYRSLVAIAYGMVYTVDSNVGVVALNQMTGTRIWPTTQQTPIGGDDLYAPAVANGVLYVSNGHGVNAIDAKKGTLLSSISINPDPNIQEYSSPIVTHGMIFFVLTNNNLYAYHHS